MLEALVFGPLSILKYWKWILAGLATLAVGWLLVAHKLDKNKIRALETENTAQAAQIAAEREAFDAARSAYEGALKATSEAAMARQAITVKLQTTEKAINHAPVTTECARSPAVNIALDSLRGGP